MRTRTRSYVVAVALVALGVAACAPTTADVTSEATSGTSEVGAGGEAVGSTTVAYGDAVDQVADLALPDGAAPEAGWPVVVLVHGGFWREQYERDLMAPLVDDLIDRGYATWNVEYRRVGRAGSDGRVGRAGSDGRVGRAGSDGRVGGSRGWPTTLTDVAAAVDHLAVVATDTPLDLGRVAAAGHSAGGHLALWLAGRTMLTAEQPGAGPRVVPCLVIGQAPVADLVAGQDLGDGAVRDLLGGADDEVPDRFAAADPAQLVGHGVPVLLVHGEDDDIVPVDQSERYAAAARIAGDEVTVTTLPGDHFTVIDPASELWAAAVDAIDATC